MLGPDIQGNLLAEYQDYPQEPRAPESAEGIAMAYVQLYPRNVGKKYGSRNKYIFNNCLFILDD